MISVTISATLNLGIMNNISTWAMTNIVMRNGVTGSGFVVTGTNGTIKCRLAVFGNNAGTTFDLTGAIHDVIDFNNNQISSSSGQTFIEAVAGASLWAKVNDNGFSGDGVYINGVTVNDWDFIDNIGIDNSPTSQRYSSFTVTPPVNEASFVITDAGVTPTSKIIASVYTLGHTEENAGVQVALTAIPGSGNFTIIAMPTLPIRKISGLFKFTYFVL